MNATDASTIVTGVDFVSVPTRGPVLFAVPGDGAPHHSYARLMPEGRR
jgi:hypothetical protein